MLIKKTHKNLEPYLMDPLSKGVDEPYFIIKTEDQAIFVLQGGQNGSEYNKTEGYLSRYPGVQMYQCLYGQGVLLMQRPDEEGDAKEFKVVTLNPGKLVTIPSGWISALVNIGKTFLIVLNTTYVSEDYLDSSKIKIKKGLVYYVVEKKGEVGFTENSNYNLHPQITSE